MISQLSQLLLNLDLLSNFSTNKTQTHSQIVGRHNLTAPTAVPRGKNSRSSHNRALSGGIITAGRGHYHNIFNYSEPQEAKAMPVWMKESSWNFAGSSKMENNFSAASHSADEYQEDTISAGKLICTWHTVQTSKHQWHFGSLLHSEVTALTVSLILTFMNILSCFYRPHINRYMQRDGGCSALL